MDRRRTATTLRRSVGDRSGGVEARVSKSGRRILVVEDEALVAMLVEDALMDAGFGIIGPAATVEEAMRLLDQERPDAVVLDLNLAGETSTPVADAAAARGIPYVIATGYGAAGLPPGHQKAMVLAKPYDPSDLTAVLSRICPA
jgi:DNA-binding NtrC family response regulator